MASSATGAGERRQYDQRQHLRALVDSNKLGGPMSAEHPSGGVTGADPAFDRSLDAHTAVASPTAPWNSS